MNDNDSAEGLLGALRDIRDNGPRQPLTGICDNVRRVLGRPGWPSLLSELMDEWPERSGTASYPVPHPDWRRARRSESSAA